MPTQRLRPNFAKVVAASSVAVLLLTSCGEGGGDRDGSPSSVTQVGSGDPSIASKTTSTEDPSGVGGPRGPVTVAVTTAATLTEPTDLVVRPGDDHLWVAERAGTVQRLAVSDDGATLTPEGAPVLDISAETTTDSERGLLGIEFAADGATLFASSTDADGNTKIARYRVEGNAVDAASEQVLFTVDQPFGNHNGGHLRLGPDGRLWLGLGDGGAADDPENRAQDPDTPLGKMVRIDPTSGDSDIVMSGLRNPWRFSFDTDDSLWIGDVGQNDVEEIDHLMPGAIEGANLGWSGREGTGENPNVDPDGRTGDDPVPPVFEYTHDDGNCSITGGFVYRGSAIANLQGAYLFADYCAGRLRAIRSNAEGGFAEELDLGVDVSQPVSWAADADGEVYVLSGSGTIERLVAR